MDRDAYVSPRELTLLVYGPRIGDSAPAAPEPMPTTTPSVTDVQLSEDGPDTVTFDDGQVLKVPHHG